jgi:anti-anti-sigma factor
LVVELDEVVDPDTAGAVERVLQRQVRAADVPVVVVDIRTALVTSATLHVLVRLRRTVRAQGGALYVVARRPLARQVLRAAGLTRVLRVSATMSAAAGQARGCPPAHRVEAGPGDGSGRSVPVRQFVGRRLFR